MNSFLHISGGCGQPRIWGAILAGLALAGGVFAQPESIGLTELRMHEREVNELLHSVETHLRAARADFRLGLFNTSWVAVGDAGLRHDDAKRVLDLHPQRIARVRLFLDPERRRDGLRENYETLQTRWYDLQRRILAMETDVGSKLGIDISWGRSLVDALKRLRDATTDPRRRAMLDQMIADLESSFRSENVAGFLQATTAAQEMLRQAMEEDPDAVDAIPDDVRQGLREGRTARSTPGEGSVEAAIERRLEELDRRLADPNLSSAERTALERMRQQLIDAAESGDEARVQELLRAPVPGAAGARPSQTTTRAPENVVSGHPNVPPGHIAVRDPATGEVRFFRSADLTGVNAGYIGEQGSRLVREKREVLEETAEGAAAGRTLYVPRVTDERTWGLRISQVSEDITGGGYAVRFRLSDPNHTGRFQVDRWQASGQGLASPASGGAGQEFEVVFPSAGAYRVEAHGQTDWGSPFVISSEIEVAF